MSAISETVESIETVESPRRLKQRIVRALLFLWTILVACPIRYWPIDHSVDNSWEMRQLVVAIHPLLPNPATAAQIEAGKQHDHPRQNPVKLKHYSEVKDHHESVK